MELAWRRWLSSRSHAIRGPLPAYELAVQAEQGLRAGHQGAPCRSRQDPADGGDEDAIGGSPAGTGNLTFEHAELVTESEDLGEEPGIRAAADDQDLGGLIHEYSRAA